MTEEVFDNIGRMFCGNCRYFGHANNSQCKRIDHRTIRFAQPWFKAYDSNQYSGCICSDFEPAEWCVYVHSVWTNFQDYWEWYSKYWIPYGNTNTLVYFTLNGDTSMRYGVNLMDFVNGTMYDGGLLKAVEKEYYKKHRVSKEYPTGYELVHEKISGIEIGGRGMAGKIYIESEDVWNYYIEHEEELYGNEKVIASNDDFGVEIWLETEDGMPKITVTIDKEEAAQEIVSTARECCDVVSELYKEYLSEEFMESAIEDFGDYTVSEQLDMIDERENELDDGIYALLSTLVWDIDGCSDDVDALCDDLKEHICEYLYRKHDISIYRPMYLEDDNGNEEFFEFPYEEMELDD